MVLSLGLYPDFDPITPAALAPSVATGLLRDDIGFKGVAISDDLGAGAVTATFTVKDAAVQAIAAGTDLVQIASPDDSENVEKAIKEAVKADEIPPERLTEAVERIIDLKRDLGLLND
jgi:beta-N-acetylhexosaminidase